MTAVATTTAPLNKLLTRDGSVRRTNGATGIEELAYPIAAHGLLQALVVRKDRKGRYGGRRRRRRCPSLHNYWAEALSFLEQLCLQLFCPVAALFRASSASCCPYAKGGGP